MITSNKEHKKAAISKGMAVAKSLIAIGLTGVITTAVVSVYSAFFMKQENVISLDLPGNDFTTDAISMKAWKEDEDWYERLLRDAYKKSEEQIEKKEYYVEPLTDLIYDPSIVDKNTIIDIPDSYKSTLGWSLKEYDKEQFTINDLEKVKDLSNYPINLYLESDISWLNYCNNLDCVTFTILAKESLDNFEQLDNLKSSSICLNSNLSFYRGPALMLDEKTFPFLKKCPNLTTLGIDSQCLSIDYEYIKSLKKERLNLTINKFDANSQKISLDALMLFDSISINMNNGSGVYDLATYFTEEEFDILMSSGKVEQIKGPVAGANEKREKMYYYFNDRSPEKSDDYIKEVKKVYREIDAAFAETGIKDTMSDTEKVESVIQYVLNKLTYNQNTEEILDEYNYTTTNPLNSATPLESNLREECYRHGYLYGALNEKGKPVCGSYAALTQVLLKRAGVSAVYASSDYHAYNIVDVDGEQFYMDTTFLDGIINLDQIIEDKLYQIPLGTPAQVYQTQITPVGIEIPEFNAEERAEKLIGNVTDRYLLKFKDQVMPVALGTVVALFAGLGLATACKNKNKVNEMDGENINRPKKV